MSPYRPNPFFAPTSSFFLPSVGDKVDQATAQAKAYGKEAESKAKSLYHDAEAKAHELSGKAENKYYDAKEAAKDTVSANPTGVDLYARFALAGALGCAVTHGALTPVDVVKTRIQLEPEVYNKGMVAGFRQVIAAEGAGALLTGLGPTVLGYSLQGALKFGGYEFWKKAAIDYLGIDKARENRQAIYLFSSAIAEFFADIALCPLEATRIRLVSQPTFANGLLGGFARIAREEGVGGFYAGFGPILFKQVPYTMAKFAVFEIASENILKAAGKSKESLTQGQSTGLNLSAGLIAGMAAAVISQPADTLLSKINKTKGLPGQSVSSRLVSMAGQLGVSGLFTGMSARLVMIGTLTAGQFLIYGDIKKALGAKGGAEIAAS